MKGSSQHVIRRTTDTRQQNGKTDQEPLGEAHHPGCWNLYVHPPPPGTKYLFPPDTNLGLDQIAAAIEGFFWPKIFWDFLTKTLDPAVKPVPVLQIINLLMGIFMLAWEWPLGFLAGSSFHRSIEARLALIPLMALPAALIYQGSDVAGYYIVAMMVYFWAYSEGEVSSHVLPATLWVLRS